MKFSGLGELGMILADRGTQIPGQPAGIGALFHQPETVWSTQRGVELIRLNCQQFTQNRTLGDGSQEIAALASPSLTGGVEAVAGMIQGFLHEKMERQRALFADLAGQLVRKSAIQGYRYVIGFGVGGRD